MEALSDLVDIFSFNEIRKRTLQSRFCSILRDTTSDQDTLVNCGGLVLPIGHMSLYVIFAPSMDDTLRTYHPKEVRMAFRSHKALFYQEGLVLNVFSSIPLTPTALFQMALLTLLCLHQGVSAPTPMERLLNVIADIPPQGHALWLSRLLHHTPIGPADGHRPLPWLTPSLTKAESTLS